MPVSYKVLATGLLIYNAVTIRIFAPSQDGPWAGYVGAQADYAAVPIWPVGYFPSLPPPGIADSNVTPCEWRLSIHPPGAIPNTIQIVATWAQDIEVRTLDNEDYVIHWRGPADFNADGDVGTDADIDDFWKCMGGNCGPHSTADFDNDGDIGTDRDIAAFYNALAGQP